MNGRGEADDGNIGIATLVSGSASMQPWEASDLLAPGVSAAIGLLQAASEPTAIAFGPELMAVYNDAFTAVLGSESDGDARDVWPLRELCAALWPRLEPLVVGALVRGESAVLEDQLFCSSRRGYAEELYLRCSCSPLPENVGGGGVVVTLADRTGTVLATRRAAALRQVVAEGASARTIAEACRSALGAVARHPSDVPFALLYLRDAAAPRLELAATAALAPGSGAAPATIVLRNDVDGVGWPVDDALERDRIVVINDVPARFGTLPAGDWPFAPRSAVVVPLICPGRDAPDGVLVAGVSARHALDAPYREFLELLVKQIAAAIAGGRAREDAARHAAAHAAARLARARRRAHLRALKARFNGIIEERTRLARELHDTLLQGVTGIALQLHAVLPHVRTSPATAAETLERIVELTEATGRDARQAVWDMRPLPLVDMDLARQLENAAQGLVAGTAVTMRLRVSGDARKLSPKRRAVAMRIVEEAVANVVRHAGACAVLLHVAYGARRVCVAVRDDGHGFEVAEDFRFYAGHWGLVGMLERARSVGGMLRVRSAPGRGTTVTVSLPVSRRGGECRAEAPASPPRCDPARRASP